MNESVWMSLGIIMTITVPFILVGTLFIVSHKLKKG
jgi:urea transporter